MLLRADALEIIGVEAVVARCHKRRAPADQARATGNLRIGQVFEGDVVTGRGQRGDSRHHRGMGAEGRDDGVGSRTEGIARQPPGAGLVPAVWEIARIT